MKKIVLQSLAVWVGLCLVAIINGSIRNFIYGPYMAELTAHQISVATGITLFGFFIYLFLKFTKADYGYRELRLIGAVWLLMTISFEFIFGHFVMGHPWSLLFNDYNIMDGRLWSLVLVWTAVGPLTIGKLFLRKRIESGSSADSGKNIAHTAGGVN